MSGGGTAVSEFVEKCRRRLVDTTMRNRLLNYRPGGRGGGVEILGEHPVAVWDVLYTAGRSMTFSGRDEEPVGEERDGADGGQEDSSEPLLAGLPGGAADDAFADGIVAAQPGRHTDNYLGTGLEQQALSKRLRRLADTARLSQQEQGVETLFIALGFLRYFEDESSEAERLAPLLLVPAVLEREGPDRWRVKARDDDPIANPALVEYLREKHGLALPALADPIDAFAPLPWFRQVQSLVARKPRWTVKADCTLGIFSFQKFVMHEDLKRNNAAFSQHEVVSQLATRSGSGNLTPSLPQDVASMDLDTDFPPERTTQVVDADSTQLRALAAVERRHHLVVQGPPGTGKSQTITNLIAGALAGGRTVLFVAEKQAALSVVSNRLKAVGLGTFCFELHSSKASKSAVVRELARTLDETLMRGEASTYDPARLTRAREELSAYARAVHATVQPLGRSVYDAVGRLTALSDAPATRVALDVAGVSGKDLAGAMELLARTSASAARVRDPRAHPWRGMQKESLDLRARESSAEAVSALAGLMPTLDGCLRDAAARYGFPADMSLLRLVSLKDLADVVGASRGVEPGVAGDPEWAVLPAAANDILGRGRHLASLEERARAVLKEGAVTEDLAAASGVVRGHGASLLRLLRPSWWSSRRKLRAGVQPGAWAGAAAAAEDVRTAVLAEAAREGLNGEVAGPDLFGVRWKGADSDWEELDAVARWLTRFRAAVQRFSLGEAALAVVERPSPPVEPLRHLAELAARALSLWRQLASDCGWPEGYWDELGVPLLCARIASLAAAPAGWQEWAEFASLRRAALGGVARPIVEEADGGRVEWKDLAAAFERRFLEWWLNVVVEETEALRRFRGATHEERIAEFRDLDRRVLEYHRTSLVARLRAQAQERLREPGLVTELTFLRDQLARQRGHRPVRELLQNSFRAIRAVKPCFLMSPMTVALCLDPTKHRFDLVVFDEASQVTPEDALGAIGRGEQIVVVGDAKQLPPTNFFAVETGQVEPAPSSDGAPSFSDLDSVLELASASGFAGAPLRWHYRSRHESLIAFSNRNFYDSSLFTFPSTDRDCSRRGLAFLHLPEGCYEGDGVNRVEARRVVDAVVRHSRECPAKSLCVGTFSLAQQLAVQDEIELRRRDDPALDEFLSLDRPEPFFVKNLESIQGDERDTVILSITYGRGSDGRVSHNFGPINGQNGWRRLNVLTTRARERMLVISSMRADEIDTARAKSGGAALLKAFLKYAETGELATGPVVDVTAQAESPFEAQVLAALVRAGVRVQPQVGVAGYRIDIGIVDPDVPGRFVCGVECDGVTYHAAESARDRDRLREDVLRGLGWRLHRVWSIDWWRDPAGQTRRLLDLIAKSKAESGRTGEAKREEAPAPSSSPVAPPSEAREPMVAPWARAGSVTRLAFDSYSPASPHARSGGILEASERTIADVLAEVLHAEGPLHADDLRARAVAAFGHGRAGWRIAERVEAGLRELSQRESVEHDGSCWRISSIPVVPRTRNGTGVPPERISSWEYQAAVVRILSATGMVQEDELVARVRDGFGFKSASQILRASVHDAIARLSAAGRVGIGGAGVALIGGSGGAP